MACGGTVAKEEARNLTLAGAGGAVAALSPRGGSMLGIHESMLQKTLRAPITAVTALVGRGLVRPADRQGLVDAHLTGRKKI